MRDPDGRLVAVVAAAADAALICKGPELVAAARNLVWAMAVGQEDVTDELVALHDAAYTASGGCPAGG